MTRLMIFSRRHEQELAEIKALAYELDERTRKGLAQLKLIRGAQERLAGHGATSVDQSSQTAAPASEDASADVTPWPGDRPAPLLAFVHIPKTAGGTVISMFAAAYSKSGVRDGGNYLRSPQRTVKAVTNPRKQEGRVLAGHVPYGVYREHLPRDTEYMTFLRDPVDRVLSHYYRHVLAKDPRVEKEIRRPGRGSDRPETKEDQELKFRLLKEALVDRRRPELTNLSTRFLCGHDAPLEELPASAVDDAKENLSRFAFIGIQEHFEESLVLLQRMLGLGSIPYQDRHVSHAGSRPTVEELPDAQRELIIESNRMDVELYRFGLELFESTVADADAGFAADVEALRARNADAREDEWRAVALASG
jgi:hypothetical protein